MAEDTKSTKSKAEGDGAEEEEDARLELLFEYLRRSLGIKPDMWAKLLKSKDFGVSHFLNFVQLFYNCIIYIYWE